MALLLIPLLILSLSYAQTLYIASASSFHRVLPVLVREFKLEFPNAKIKLTFSSSGHLYAQIKGGAPYDLFISADTFYTKKLIESGKALESSYVEYAEGLLALYGSFEGNDLKEILLKADKIAIANPKHAPYGRAAVEFLKNLGIYDYVRKKIVYGANVSQALQFVYSRGAQVGIVAYSLVKGKEGVLLPPEELYTPIKHSAVITIKGMQKDVSKDFIEFLNSARAVEILKEYGFKVSR